MVDEFENPEIKGGGIRHIPTIKYYLDRYGNAFEGNDQKGFDTFKMYESQEKVRRLQSELQWLRSGKVDKQVCDAIIGKKRSAKWQGYEKWGSIALQWLAKKY